MNMPRHERRPLLDIGKRPKRTSEDWGDTIVVLIACIALLAIGMGWLG